ncbi:MAG: universal stress protein [Pirellulaceae bacterium]
MIKRILLALGDSEYSKSSIFRAVELALLHSAEVTAVTALNMRQLTKVGSVPLGAGSAARDLIDYRVTRAKECLEETIHSFQESCESAGINYSLEHETGSPFDLVTNRSRYYDLMICGLRHVFDDGVTEESPYAIVRLIDAGVRPILAEASEFRPVRRLLIAYSGSMESAKTMKRMVQLHLWPNPALRVVTYGKSADEARELLRDAVALCAAHGYGVESEHLTDRSEQALLDDARRWKADLIVMGSTARRLWFRRVLGESTLRVMGESDISLFVSQ